MEGFNSNQETPVETEKPPHCLNGFTFIVMRSQDLVPTNNFLFTNICKIHIIM